MVSDFSDLESNVISYSSLTDEEYCFAVVDFLNHFSNPKNAVLLRNNFNVVSKITFDITSRYGLPRNLLNDFEDIVPDSFPVSNKVLSKGQKYFSNLSDYLSFVYIKDV